MPDPDTSPAALRALADELDSIDISSGEMVAEHCSATLRALAAEKEAGAPAPDADGWIPWEGGECPCPVKGDVYVDVILRDGFTPKPRPARNFRWGLSDICPDGDIIAYRLSKEGMTVTADGWIKWKGGECPVAKDTLVYVRLRNGSPLAGPYRAETVTWSHDDTFRSFDIIAYRIAKEG